MTRLMCSQNRTEVEAIRKELFKAGIPSEIRSNPLAAALRVTRLELWLQDERDFFNASKLCAGMQERVEGRPGGAAMAREKDEPTTFIDVDADEDGDAHDSPAPGPNGVSSSTGHDQDVKGLQEVSSLLEKEIEGILEREGQLSKTCTALQGKVNDLDAAIAQSQTALAREREGKAAAEKKRDEAVGALQGALEREQSERARLENQLERERRELRQELAAREQALKEVQKTLEAKSQQLQLQQAAVVDLRKELVSLELQREEHDKSLSKSRAEAVMEREARIAAEERAEKAVAARKALESQLVAQKELQAQVHAHLASLNSLCIKLQAKKIPRPESQE